MPVAQPRTVIATSQKVLDEEEVESDPGWDPWGVTENIRQDEVTCALPSLVDIAESLSENAVLDLSPEWTTAVDNGHASAENGTVVESNMLDTCSEFSVKQLFDGEEQQHSDETASLLFCFIS